ncbi:MAG TPA: (d)CMP kinase [Phycisphaerae bacterium]|nr:(d)CMP kinase [Phycisphaerae bacterium]HUT60200.1 (d)CMP kinase [Phycisphaerae bacterium]
MIVTIDGPAGSGKSTAARALAEAMGISYLESGATYRAVTLKAMREGADWDDEAVLVEIARRADVRLIQKPDGLAVMLDGRDVTREIRSPEVTENSHHMARSGPVRKVIAALLRRIGEGLGEFVSEGRDQGSVVFPEASPKFYLDASPEVRARRRCEQMLADGRQADYEQVLRAVVRRDERDRNRAVSPLIKPAGAIEIDTTGKTVAQTVAEMLAYVEARR